MTRKDIAKYISEVEGFPKPGISFKDVSPILATPKVLDFVTKEFAKEISEVDVIVGPDARGFLFGTPLAIEANKPFIMVRKPGKLPGNVISKEYELEYGTDKLEMLEGVIKPGMKVAIVDDLLATGGTTLAIKEMVENLGATVTNALFVVNLTFLEADKKFGDTKVTSLVNY